MSTQVTAVLLDFVAAATKNAAASYSIAEVGGQSRPPEQLPAVKVRYVRESGNGYSAEGVAHHFEVITYARPESPLPFDINDHTEPGHHRRVKPSLTTHASGDLGILDRDGAPKVWALANGTIASVIPFVARWVFPLVPVVSAPGSGADQWTQALAAGASGPVGPVTGVPADRLRLVACKAGESGSRVDPSAGTVTVTAKLHARPHAKGRIGDVTTALDRAAHDQVGKPVTGLGRCLSVETIGNDADLRGQGGGLAVCRSIKAVFAYTPAA